MRILLDTNIIIYREDNAVIPDELQKLMQLMQKNKIDILVHPQSINDIKRDTNIDRQSIVLSKINAYLTIATKP